MEFALVFPMLFILFYSVVIYSYLFILQESVSYAAQEAAAAAHRVDPEGGGNFDELVGTQVRNRAAQVLDWLPESQKSRVLGTAACSGGDGGNASSGVEVCIDNATDVVIVNVRFDVAGLFPVLSMPLIGELPPMPAQLLGSGTALVGDT